MNTTVKLGGFALALTLLLAGGYGAGRLAGPVPAADTAGSGHADGGHSEGGHEETGDDTTGYPGGLLVSDQGYTMQPVTGPGPEFGFQITGPDGRPVTRYDIAHGKLMHLIVVRRDLSGFRHVHPELGKDGVWRVASPFGAPGSYRAYADFTPTGGDPLTLGVDVPVTGQFTPRPLPEPAATATVDGYTVTLAGTLQPGHTSKLTLTVSRDGAPVTDLEPYLEAYGHLVALRAGDLAYLHVHPDGEPGDGRTAPGPAIVFYAEVPSAGTYRLYLDFQHAGKVRTAEFTVRAGEPAATPTGSPAATTSASPAPEESGHGDDHGH